MPAFFIASGFFSYGGAAIAVGLFAIMAPLGVVWWRIALGSLVLLVLWRPWRQVWTLKAVLFALALGFSLVALNSLFYESIARMPIGAAVSVEYMGPVAVAVIRGRGWIPRVAAGLALAGIVLIGGWGLDLTDHETLVGFLFILAAAAAWAVYILLGSHISRRRPSGPSLAIGLTAATILCTPFMFVSAFHVSFTWHVALMLLGVSVLSTAIPYSIDAIAFGRISEDVFALLTALMPATSMVVGAVMLQQIPNAFELAGLALVSVAVWLAGRAPQRGAPTETEPSPTLTEGTMGE